MKRIYVLETEIGCKVGVSADPLRRIKALSLSSPMTHKRTWVSDELANAFAIERIVHHQLKPHEIKNEWFSVGFDEAVELVKETMKKSARYDEPEKPKPPDEKQIPKEEAFTHPEKECERDEAIYDRAITGLKLVLGTFMRDLANSDSEADRRLFKAITFDVRKR